MLLRPELFLFFPEGEINAQNYIDKEVRFMLYPDVPHRQLYSVLCFCLALSLRLWLQWCKAELLNKQHTSKRERAAMENDGFLQQSAGWLHEKSPSFHAFLSSSAWSLGPLQPLTCILFFMLHWSYCWLQNLPAPKPHSFCPMLCSVHLCPAPQCHRVLYGTTAEYAKPWKTGLSCWVLCLWLKPVKWPKVVTSL